MRKIGRPDGNSFYFGKRIVLGLHYIFGVKPFFNFTLNFSVPELYITLFGLDFGIDFYVRKKKVRR